MGEKITLFIEYPKPQDLGAYTCAGRKTQAFACIHQVAQVQDCLHV